MTADQPVPAYSLTEAVALIGAPSEDWLRRHITLDKLPHLRFSASKPPSFTAAHIAAIQARYQQNAVTAPERGGLQPTGRARRAS